MSTPVTSALQRAIGDAQHALDSHQLSRWLRGSGHLTGGPATPDIGLTVEVPGDAEVLLDGETVAVDEFNNTADVTPDDDRPRWSIISVQSDGSVVATDGDARQLVGDGDQPAQVRNPAPPLDYPGVCYAAVFVPAGANGVTADEILDRRLGASIRLGSVLTDEIDIDEATVSNLIADAATIDGNSSPYAQDPHALGGGQHAADTLADLNSKVSDATLDDTGDPRDPTEHGSGSHDGTVATNPHGNAEHSEDFITGVDTADGTTELGEAVRYVFGANINVNDLGNGELEVAGDADVAITSLDPQIAVNGEEPTADDSDADNPLAIAVADDALANGDDAVAIGNGSEASEFKATALGSDATASNTSALALGRFGQATGDNAVTLGGFAEATDSTAMALGVSSKASDTNALAIGHTSEADGSEAAALGNNAEASNSGATAVGNNAEALDSSATALGNNAEASAFVAAALGRGAKASGTAATALGVDAEASGNEAVALGNNAEALTDNSGTIGVATGDSGPSDWTVPGDFTVQGSKDFEIDHPSDPGNKDLRHGAYEGPVPGGLIYNATVSTDEERISLAGELPEYVTNGDFGTGWTCHVTASDHLGNGYVDTDEWTLVVEEPGDYEVTIFGERDDERAVDNGKHRTEKPKGERWNGDPNTYWRNCPHVDATQYDDVERVEAKFAHTPDCPKEPCPEAHEMCRVTFDDGERVTVDDAEFGEDGDSIVSKARGQR